MPNWCNNNLTLTHKDPAMITRAFNALESGTFLEEFCPVPKSLHIVAGSVGDPDEQKKLEADTARNIEVHGYGNWYDWCCAEWGTKWDCGEQGASDIHPGGTMLHTFFDTAWSPPVGAYEKLEALGFEVDAQYYEPGMGYAGQYSNGSDEELSLEGMTADDVEREYPDLDESFGIAESMRDYEAENAEEELTEWIRDGIEQKKQLVTL